MGEKENSITYVQVQNREVDNIKKEVNIRDEESKTISGLATKEDLLQQKEEIKTSRQSDKITEDNLLQGDTNNIIAGETSKPQDKISDLSEKNEKNKDIFQKETF